VLSKLVSHLGSLYGRTIGVLGLAFKANTDDMREAPSVDIIRRVIDQGAKVRVYDPIAMTTGREALQREGVSMEQVQFCQDAYEVAQDSDAIVLVTEWNEFTSLNMPRVHASMRRPVVIDGRNVFEAGEMNRLGFIYCGIGRGNNSATVELPDSEGTSSPPLVGAGNR
jgi:UDPglucose 6-dehydrogenase